MGSELNCTPGIRWGGERGGGARAKGTLVNILNKVLFRYTGFQYTILLVEYDTFCQHSSIGDIDEEWDVKGKKHLLSNNADIDATKNNAIEHILYVNFAQCWDENMHFEHLSHLRQSRCKSKHLWLACVAGVKGVWGVGEGGGVRKRRRERLLQERRLLHFAPYCNYSSCHFNDQSELGARFSAWLTSPGNVSPKAVS